MIDWERVESLFHEALALPENQRPGFLHRECHGDPNLQQEVVSLLSHHQEQQHLVEQADVPGLLRELDLGLATLEEGRKLGPYVIVRLVGKGGMGEVYLARDPRLGRKVAIKVLPLALFDDHAGIERLRREARAASLLNHPNILTVYDFGEQDELQYMVSEFVEGISLRERIGRLSVEEAINYARQVGQALAAAHAAGIIHRDIKPENVMIRTDGYIKVLDYGLAKSIPSQLHSGQGLYDQFTASGQKSVAGVLIGTVNYMSPEQVRGEAVDSRTDIWSWGVLLYEMVAGRRPFEATTSLDTMAAILNQPPAPLGRNKKLNALVTKALSKQPEDRYQTMSEALADLARIPVSSTTALRPSSMKPVSWVLRGILTVLLALAGYEIYRLVQTRPEQPFRIDSSQPLTTSGNVVQQAISPDGKYLVYATQEQNGQALRIRQIDVNAERELIPSSPGPYRGITFSRDGQFIYYVLQENEKGRLYRLPLVGGPPRLIIGDQDISYRISFSPDGNRFVFQRYDDPNPQTVLILATLDGKETTLANLRFPGHCFTPPAWSPDTRNVLCGIRNNSGPGYKILSVHVPDGRLSEAGPEPWLWMGNPIWLGRGHSIAVAAENIDSMRSQLWEITWPDAKVSPMTRDAASYTALDATADSQNLTAIQTKRVSPIWLVPFVQPEKAQLVSESGATFYGIAWSNSGRLISETDVGGNADLWSIDPKNGRRQRITEDPYLEQYPDASHDGRYLVYASNHDGTFHLWRSDADGGHPMRLTSNKSVEEEGAITPDSQWVVFTSLEGGSYGLWKVSIGAGVPSRITSVQTRKPAISPDGNWIACEYFVDPVKGWSIAILRSNGELVRLLPAIPTGGTAGVRWSADGGGLLYVQTRNGVSNVWLQPIDGGPSRQLTYFREHFIFAFALSPDGRSVACVRGTRSADVVLIKKEQAGS